MAEVDGIPTPITDATDRTLSLVQALTGAVQAIGTVEDKNNLIATMAMMKRGVEDERRQLEEAMATLPEESREQMGYALKAMTQQIKILDDCTERLQRGGVVDAMAALQVRDA